MKSEGQKLKLFTLKRILEENTDEHHGLISFIKHGKLHLEHIKPRELSAVNRCNSQVK